MSINNKILVNAIIEGESKAGACRLAGSRAKNPTKTCNRILKNHPELVIKMKEKMQEKISLAIENMTQDKAEASNFKDLIKSVEIAQRIINLEEGRPTEIIETRIMNKAEILDRMKEIINEHQK